MKKSIIYLALGFTVAFLSYKIVGMGFLWLFFGLISLLFLIPVWVIAQFRKTNKIFFTVPLLITGICFFGVFASLFRPYEDAVLKQGSKSEQLKYAYETDQNDRKKLKSYIPYISKLRDRDAERLNLAKRLVDQDEKLEPMAKFYTAFILHHSDG